MAGGNKMSPGTLLGNVAGWAGGWALQKYTGANLWIPGGTMLVAFLVFAKTPLRPRHFMPAIAVILGHLAWFVAGAALTGSWMPASLDVIVLGAGIAWLWARPGLGPCLTLVGFEIVTLVINVVALVSVEVGSPEHRALTVHCLFRAFALAGLGFGYRTFRKSLLPSDQQPTPPLSAAPGI
jgi:hypothetical protein